MAPEYFLLASLKRPKAGRLSMRIFWRRRTGAGRPDGPIYLENSPEWGLGGSAARSSWYDHPPAAQGTRADEGGGPYQGFLYGCFFLP